MSLVFVIFQSFNTEIKSSVERNKILQSSLFTLFQEGETISVVLHRANVERFVSNPLTQVRLMRHLITRSGEAMNTRRSGTPLPAAFWTRLTSERRSCEMNEENQSLISLFIYLEEIKTLISAAWGMSASSSFSRALVSQTEGRRLAWGVFDVFTWNICTDKL